MEEKQISKEKVAFERMLKPLNWKQTFTNSLFKSCSLSLFCDSNHWSYRYTILALICVINVVTCFADDMTDGLPKAVITVMDINTLTFEYMDAFSGIPCIVLSLIGGILVDRVMGRRRGILLATSIMILGEIIFCSGIFLNHYWMMIVGTVVVNIGDEMLCVVGYSFQAKWFRTKELGVALGFDSSAECLGSALAMALSNPFYEFLSFIPQQNIRLGVTCLLGPAAAILAFLCSLGIVFMDTYGSKPTDKDKKKFKIKKDQFKFYNYFTLYLWLVLGVSIIYDNVVEAFSTIGQLFFVKKFKLSTNKASIANSLLSAINIILLPLTGLLVDVVGYHIFWTMIGVLIGVATHLLLLLSSPRHFVPFIAQVMYAISDSLFCSALSPVPAYLVPESHEATVYGIIGSFEAILYIIVILATGYIADTGGFKVLEMFYSLLLFVAFIMALDLCLLDATSDESTLNISAKTRKAREEEESSSSSSSSSSDGSSSSSSSSDGSSSSSDESSSSDSTSSSSTIELGFSQWMNQEEPEREHTL